MANSARSRPRSAASARFALGRTLAPGAHADYTFLLAWHFPNRTPRRCGWNAPHGQEDALIGNWYTTRFADAWAAAEYTVENLPALERKTRRFAAALRESTIPGAVKDAASANLSTLVTQVCFRTADGEFHGFEGANDQAGCCHGSCAHVWNYETTTAHLFPTFARSLRTTSFGYDLDEAGALHFRENLPHAQPLWGFAAADGQMGQILHAYLDWRLSGDLDWLRRLWPGIKRAIEFAWTPGGWDADRDGVLEGVQHNTYDVEFYGPNPLCGIYYLGALRAAEEMARAVGDADSATQYHRLFESGSRWTDANLFNGEYYVQHIRGVAKDKIAPSLRSEMGSEDTVNPQYQVGEGCLADQLIGQYLADVAGLGPLRRARSHSQDARLHLSLQLPPYPDRPSVRRAHLRAQRRSRAPGLRLRQGRAPAHSLPLLRRNLDRHRIPGGRADALRRHDSRGARNLSQRPPALRRRKAQPVGRARMRPPLRAGHVGLERYAGDGRLPLPRRRAIGGDSGARRPPLPLGHRHRLGHVPGHGFRRGYPCRARNPAVARVRGERAEIFAGPDDRRRRGSAPVKPVVALVGGFLGAGKTTLILKAARLLQARGIRAAAVLNDQGDDLVDTELARRSGTPSGQVSGGCFCCRFPDLVEALERLAAHRPEIIFAEAVGSCTDLVATTLRPLLRDYAGEYRIAPLTVLVHDEPREPDLHFLFERQVAEADLVIRRDVDVAGWLDLLLAANVPAATKTIAVDYARYARAEAALGWLNARATVRPAPPAPPAMIVGPLVDALDAALTAAAIRIVHLKAMAQCESGYVKAALTANGREPAVEGALDASPSPEHDLLLNLRALGAPEALHEIVERALADLGAAQFSITSFRPAPPAPWDWVRP